MLLESVNIPLSDKMTKYYQEQFTVKVAPLKSLFQVPLP